MIIDFHCHAGVGDLMNAPWNTRAPLGAYLRRARAAGVHKTVVLPVFHTRYQAANAQLASLVARLPQRLIGFAAVNTATDRGRVEPMVSRAVKQWGFRGIKVHGSDGQISREVCEAARRLRVPLLVDVVGRPEILDMIVPEYRDVNIVVAHLGSFADDWRAHQRLIDQLARYPNLYADTSGVRRFDYLVQAVRRAGPEKLLYGSDGPWLHPALELEKIRLLRLRSGDEALVLGGNAQRLLGIELGRNRERVPVPTGSVPLSEDGIASWPVCRVLKEPV